MGFKQTYRVWQPLALLLLLLWGMPAHAAVQEVRVLATGVDHSSSKAAALALDFAKQRAVYLVARKMEVDNPSAKLQALNPGQWDAIVRGATVLQTKRVGEVTYADVSVSVVTEALRRALGVAEHKAGLAQADDVLRGVMVLPVLIGASRAYLWEDENIMREPLRGEILRQARGSVVMPAGDFEDRRLIDYQNALDVSAKQLQEMFNRYGSDEIIVAIVTLGNADTMEPTKVLLRRLAQPPEETKVEAIEIKPDRPNDTTQARADKAATVIAAAVTRIAGATSQRQQARLAKAPQLPVTFRYATARDLANMQQALRHATGVLQLVMPAIALQDMHGVLYLNGDKQQVKQQLLRQGYFVTDDGDGWVISVH